MNSDEDFTDEEFADDPVLPSKTVSSTVIRLEIDSAESIRHEDYSKKYSHADNVRSGSVRFPNPDIYEEQAVEPTGNLSSSVVPLPMNVVQSTSRVNLPGTSSGNEVYMQFLAERKDDNFSSDDFSSDDQRSVKDWDGFEDVNDNSKVKRDLQALQAYLSQDESSCDESQTVNNVGVIGAIPHLSSSIDILGGHEALSREKIITESLKRNKECVERLDRAKEAFEKTLAEIRARFIVVTKEISAAIKETKSDGWVLKLCFGSPYFRDDRGFIPPYNADYEGKVARKEIIRAEYLQKNTWLVQDSKIICDEVRNWEIEGMLLERQRERYAIRRKIAQCEDKDEKAALEEQLDAEEDLETEDLTLENVVGTRKDGHPDWLAMAVNKLRVDRSAETIQAVWENFLDPRLPKGGWSDDEDHRLREIALAHNEQDWPAIAAELDTGRTGFMCFMRYKAAVDRDFLGMRFDPQEDNFVRRSVAATTFNNTISWDQAEFLYRGRRDKRSLKMRWNRLEADENEEIKKGKFSKDEDVAILRWTRELGTSDFATVARHACGKARSATQVQMRHRTLTTENVRGQWSVDEDVALVRLVSHLGRDWRKVREAFGEHRTKEQLRFRHEAVAKYVHRRLKETKQTVEQVLDEMATTGHADTRLQNARLRRLRLRTRLVDMNEDELHEQQVKTARARRNYYSMKKSAADLEDQFIKFFAVSYTPPEAYTPPPNPPAPRALADALSLLLATFAVDVSLPTDDVLDPTISDPVLGPAIAVLRADLAARMTNADDGHSGPCGNSSGPDLTFQWSDERCGDSSVNFKSSSSDHEQSSWTRNQSVHGESPRALELSNGNAVKGKCDSPVVSIRILESIKLVPEIESQGSVESTTGTLRRSNRGLLLAANRLADTAKSAATKKVLTKSQSAKVANKKKKEVASEAKTVKNKSLTTGAGDKAAKKQPIRAYAKPTKTAAKPVAGIDLEPTVAAKAIAVQLASLLPLKPDVTPLQSRAAADALAAKVEIVSNGKKIVLTKVAAPPPGAKVAPLPPGITFVGRGAVKTAAPAVSAIPISPTTAQANTKPAKRSAPSSPLSPPCAKKLKPAPEVNLWPACRAGRPSVPSVCDPHVVPSMFSLPGERIFRRRPARGNSEVWRMALPPGLVSMIGFRTFLASVNALPTVAADDPLPDEDGYNGSKECREAARLWESRIFTLFAFPGLLARNPLLCPPLDFEPPEVPPPIANMRRLFPPVAISRLPTALRCYSRKQPKDN